MSFDKLCKNCNRSMEVSAKYCADCGQKYIVNKPTLISILGDFFSNVFDLDSAIYRSFWALFVPGKLTNEFLNGRTKSFAPPIRVFIVSSIFFVGALSLFIRSQVGSTDSAYIAKLHRHAFVKEIDSLKTNLYQKFQDSILFDITDTLKNDLIGKEKFSVDFRILQFSENYLSVKPGVAVPMTEIYTLSEEEFLSKNKITGFLSQLLVRQQIKVVKDGSSFINYFLGRISILALIMMPIVALLLKLLFLRNKRYYVEHFIFSLHYHSFAFVMVGLLFLLWHFTIPHIIFALPVFLSIMVYLYQAMKQTYQQSAKKTIFKFFLLNVSYLFLIILFVITAGFISFLIF